MKLEPRALPIAIAPFLAGFREIERRLEYVTAFALVPVEVPGPDVARALGEYLTNRGHPALVIDPRDDDAAWSSIAATLLRAKPLPDGVVIVIGSAEPPRSIHAGLRILNQRRDALTKQMDRPLIWCGPASFLNLCWEGAPDFWSIRTIDYRLEEEVKPKGVADARLPDANDPAATLESLLARADMDPYTRARSELALARLLEDTGDLSRAEAAYRSAIALARGAQDLEMVARGLIGAFGIAARTGRAEDAEAPLREAEDIAKRLGDRALEASAVAALSLAAHGGHDAKKGEERLAQAKSIIAEVQQAADATTGAVHERVDVLILTALQDELEAVLAFGDGWAEKRDLGGFRYFQRSFSRERRSAFVVAAAWIGEMGERTAAIRGQQLLAELEPSCLAMCGICAGYRRKVSLGDVIVADRIYAYDEGKLVVEPGKEAEFFHALRTFDLQAAWKMDAAFLAEEIDLTALSAERPPSKDAQRRWLLHAIDAHGAGKGPSPADHPERRKVCPGYSIRLKELLAEGLVIRKGRDLSLTAAGRDWVDEDLALHPDGLPPDPPLRVHVGAIATGSAVVEDPAIFERLRKIERGTIGIEMEGAALGELAQRFDKRSILVKAVQDYADGTKDDSFRAFACRASAEFLLSFLLKHFEPERSVNVAPTHQPSRTPLAKDERRSLEFLHEREEERIDTFLARVERIALLRDPGAGVTRHRAPAPFAGVLEVEVREGPIVDVRVIAALERPVTEALFTQYVTEVEQPFRQRNPYVRTMLIHTGPQAPFALHQDAARRGVFLKSFSEYQGLIDFSRYLERQTDWLDRDPVYPPWLYVNQPARVSLANVREEEKSADALNALWSVLEAPAHPRFALVLGDFGAGKTFLLHELARRMAKEKHPLVPVLVEMSKLEKQHSLQELLGAHFSRFDMHGYSFKAFEYMLSEGRIALFFDGFDELALRVTYDRAVEHFDTVIQAAKGLAKVVISSRRQYFLTDAQIKRALAERAERVPGYRLFLLEPFGEPQIRRFLSNLLPDQAAAEERYRLLDEVKDLLGLSKVPRMLSFIAKIDADKLREAKKQTGDISAAKLYELLVDQWLDFEFERANPKGAERGVSRKALREAMTSLSMLLWARPTKTAEITDIRGCLVASILALGEPPLDPDVLAHLFGSGSLLVRDEAGVFSFVHRSVLEWFVAEVAAREVEQKGEAAALDADEMSDLMADFFATLAGPDPAFEWASAKMAGAAEENTKKNAARVLRRIEKIWGKLPEVEIEIPVTVSIDGQDFRGQDLSGIDWSEASLVGADLRGATLVDAKLWGASLVRANLSHADLRRANLSRADLAEASFSFARLCGADLSLVEHFHPEAFRGTNLLGAKGIPDEREAELVAAGAAPPMLRRIEPMCAAGAACASVAWSPCGELLATGHEDGTVRLIDTITGQVIGVFSGHRGAVNAVAFSPDGNAVASSSDDKTVRLWDASSGELLRKFKGHQKRVLSVVFSPDGQTLASGAEDNTVRVWDASSGRLLRVCEGHQNWVSSVAFSPDGQALASGSYDNTVRLWDASSGRLLRVCEGQQKPVLSIAFSPDGKTLASGSYDNTVRLWDASSGRPLRVLEGHQNWVRSIAFSPDGKTLASGSYDQTVRLWDASSGRLLRVFEGHQYRVLSVAFSPDGKTLASGSNDNTVRLWDASSGRLLRVLEGHQNWVLSVTFSPDGKTLASGSYDQTVRLWDASSGRLLLVFEGHQNWVTSVAFSPDGKTLASGSNDNTVRLWDASSGRLLLVFDGHQSRVTSVAFSPDGKTLASGSSDQTVRLWDASSGRLLLVFEGHQNWVLSVAFSPDGNALASGSYDKTVRLWDASSGRLLRVFEGHQDSVFSVAFSPDGNALASGSVDRTVRLWDALSGRMLRIFEGHQNRVWSVAFSPDGKTLVSGSYDKTVRLWDASSGKLLCVFEGHQHWVLSVAFSPDGKTLASGSEDNTVRLWDIPTARCLAILLTTPEGWVAFSPDGRYKLGGDIAGSFWHVAGLCRFEPGELDLRLPDDADFRALPPPPDVIQSNQRLPNMTQSE